MNTYPMYLGIQGDRAAPASGILWKPAANDDPKFTGQVPRRAASLCDFYLGGRLVLEDRRDHAGLHVGVEHKYTKWAERLRVYGTVGNVATIYGI